ncbi:FMRFamide receptor-like [Elysia marginata]|uniref:FMRFamide receptor-like n=1 Tax=Elysia marginata TaxID=1093978 RepID=A0AAV4HK94_9GAST|nr:FMRFamide receptor-like [Elysia marginata]
MKLMNSSLFEIVDEDDPIREFTDPIREFTDPIREFTDPIREFTSENDTKIIDVIFNKTFFSVENVSEYVEFCSSVYYDGSCPPPSDADIRRIKTLCAATSIQVSTVFSIALAFGLPGSVFTLVTASSLKFRSPTNLYLSSLAVSDFLALFLASLTSYKATDNSSFTDTTVIVLYVNRIFQALSHWILALICIERFISVQLPMHKARLYRDRVVFFSIFVAFWISSIPFPVSYVSTFHYYNQNKFVERAQTILYTLVYIIIPGALIVIFTFLTARQLKRRTKNRMSMTSGRSLSDRSVAMETQLTRMMFLTVACFVVFTLPWAVIHIYDRFKLYNSDMRFCAVGETIYMFVFFALWACSFLNHSINFYVYCACANGFRDQFCHVIRCNKKELNNGLNN